MCRLAVQVLKVPKIVVRRLRLRYFIMWLWFGGVDKVRELDGVLDEEDGNVVPDDVPVALLRVELHSEAADVADRVCGTTGPNYR